MSQENLIDSRSGWSGPSRTGDGRVAVLFLAALAGMGTLIIEIVGVKLLAPYLGNSHFVWTNQILATLLALTAGYYLGGRLADRVSGDVWVYAAFASAGLSLCLALLVFEKAVYFFLRFHLAAGAILSAFFL